MYMIRNAILKMIRLINSRALILPFIAFCCAVLVSMLVIRPALAASQHVNQPARHVVCCESGGVESGGGVYSGAGEGEGSSTSSGSYSSDSGDEGPNGGGRSYIPIFSSSQEGSGSDTSNAVDLVLGMALISFAVLLWWVYRRSRRQE